MRTKLQKKGNFSDSEVCVNEILFCSVTTPEKAKRQIETNCGKGELCVNEVK